MITIMVRWAVTAEEKNYDLVEKLREVPFNIRDKNEQLISLVQELRQKWVKGTKIERLATLGWNETEACKTFSDILENLPLLREQYREQVKVHGKPPELDDKDLTKFEKAIREERKRF